MIATMLGVILYVSPNYAGPVHDKRMAEDYTIPPEFALWQDTGYQGYAPEGVTVVQPKSQKAGN